MLCVHECADWWQLENNYRHWQKLLSERSMRMQSKCVINHHFSAFIAIMSLCPSVNRTMGMCKAFLIGLKNYYSRKWMDATLSKLIILDFVCYWIFCMPSEPLIILQPLIRYEPLFCFWAHFYVIFLQHTVLLFASCVCMINFTTESSHMLDIEKQIIKHFCAPVLSTRQCGWQWGHHL